MIRISRPLGSTVTSKDLHLFIPTSSIRYPMYNYLSLCTLLHDILSTNSVVIVILSCLESQIRYSLSIPSLPYLFTNAAWFVLAPLPPHLQIAAGFVISVPFTDIARLVVSPSVPFTNPVPFFNLS